jgi:glycosyltransferase involved in cell wall biosynthesis
MVQRLMRDGDARGGAIGTGLCADDARALLRAWLAAVELDLTGPELLAHLQHEDFSHADLFRRARRCHERKLAHAVEQIAAAAPGSADLGQTAQMLFDACLAAIPYAPAAAFLGREKAKLAQRDGEPLRVALVADAVGGMHGVTHTLDELRERGVPGFEVEVVGTDHNVDRRLSAVAEVDIPFYAGLKVGVPSLPAIVEALAEGRYDLVHLCSPGPSGAAAAVIARTMGVPVLGSYHTELAAYAGLRSQDPALELVARMAIAAFYGQCRRVLSPSPASDEVLRGMGVPDGRIGRWDRGVDLGRFSPDRRVPGLLPGEITVLYAGRLTREKGADLLADAFLAARECDPRLHLALAGGGPEEHVLRERLGGHATFLGWLEGDALATAYASADLFLFASRTDTFGQVLLEAQASGLPVVAVGEGGPTSIVVDDVTGRLCAADADALADAIVELASQPLQRERLARNALDAVR